MLAPLAAGWFLNEGVFWRDIYHWELLLIAGMFLYFVFMTFPKKEAQEHEGIDFKQLSKVTFQSALIWYYIALALYVAAEIGMAAWLVTFLQEEQSHSVSASTRALTIFFGTIMLGRFIGGFLVHRIGYLRSILFASTASVICIAVGLFGPPSLSFFLPLTGLFFSIIFPTITAAVSDAHTKNTNSILGMLFTCAGTGGMFGPWLVGWVSDALGLRTGFSVNLIFAVLMTLAILVLMKERKHDTTAA